MVIDVPAVAAGDMATHTGSSSNAERTAIVRERVAQAYRRQIERQGKPNARLVSAEVERHCRRTPATQALLAQAMSRLSLSARGYHRVLKVARTIADLGASSTIEATHVAEAIGYRREPGVAA